MEITNTELDRRIAELMGWHEGKEPMHYQPCWNDKNEKCVKLQRDWHPSELVNLHQAWQVVEKLDMPQLHINRYRGFNKIRVQIFSKADYYEVDDVSLPRAICLAALQVGRWGNDTAHIEL
jgi:hypothetical protein